MKKLAIILGVLALLSGAGVAASATGFITFGSRTYASNPCPAGKQCVYPNTDGKPHAVAADGTELGAWGSGGGGGAITWTAPTFSGAWSNFGSIYDTAAYGKDSLGFVNMRGLITGGAGAIFTLPTGFRPLHSVFILTTGAGGVSPSTAVIEVDADGTVSMTGANTAVSLWPVRFIAEQ